jgi:adenosine/AMP kinase
MADLLTVSREIAEETNVIVGKALFISVVDDYCEAVVTTRA